MTEKKVEYVERGYLTQEVLSALAEQFPADAHETKSMGGQGITYVSWHHYVTRLNAVAPDWSMGDPIIQVIGGKLVMGLPLTIYGVTRINFGDETQDKDSYGTAGTNAFAQAFKRTAALFGLGLYLYDGGAPRERQRSQGKPKEAPADARAVEVFFGKHNGKTLGAIAAEDRGYLKWLASEEFEPKGEDAALIQRAAQALIAKKNEAGTAKQLSERWPAAVEHICETTTFYIKDGQPNEFLMLSVAMQHGLGEIRDENIEEVVAKLLEHAEQGGKK